MNINERLSLTIKTTLLFSCLLDLLYLCSTAFASDMTLDENISIKNYPEVNSVI